VAAAAVASGCAILPSAYRLDVWKTVWVVSGVDDASMPGKITL
jgi:hypothetical protein